MIRYFGLIFDNSNVRKYIKETDY